MYLQVSHKFLSNAINNHVTRQNIAILLRSLQNEAEFFFLLPDYKSMHLLEINYSVPLILHFQRKINYFTASLCKLQSLLFCFLPKHKNNNNNTLVFIAEPDAHKFDNGKINQRKVTCNVYTYVKEGGDWCCCVLGFKIFF